MEKTDIEELRSRVPCAAALQKAGFAIDLKESTRRAVKYRRGDDIIIVIHHGKGWFDARSEAKGDVFSLVEHLDGVGFVEVLQRGPPGALLLLLLLVVVCSLARALLGEAPCRRR